jgi:hypothetical protein
LTDPLHSRVLAAALTSAFFSLLNPATASEYHVSPAGADSNDGAPAAMLQTISKVAEIARPGDVITVHAGIYRERVNPPRSGSSDTMRIVYQAAPGEQVVLKGSEPITGWQHVQDNTWMVSIPNTVDVRGGGSAPVTFIVTFREEMAAFHRLEQEP